MGVNELALFAGAGGGILGGQLLGWRTVCAVERDAYAAQVLAQRQTDGCLEPFPIWSDVCSFDGKPWRGLVDVVSGGFPCQDISAAGKGAGIDGKRSGLWAEMARIVRDVRPRYVLVENSPALTARGLGRVLGDLAAIGYDTEWLCLSAADVGAPHLRDRIWIMGYAERRRQQGRHAPIERRSSATMSPSQSLSHADGGRFQAWRQFWPRRPQPHVSRIRQTLANAGGVGCHARRPNDRQHDRKFFSTSGQHAVVLSDAHFEHDDHAGHGTGAIPQQQAAAVCQRVADAESAGLPNRRQTGKSPRAKSFNRAETLAGSERCGGAWWAIEPGLGRVANGVAYRVDRIRAIGNGQVPAVAATAFKVLTQPEINDSKN